MADGEDGAHANLAQVTEGEWAGWWFWKGNEPFEDLAGQYYFREDEDGTMRAAFRAEHKHMNGADVMHGGCLLAFADYSLFVIGRSALQGKRAVTTTLNAEFVGPVYEGEFVEATGDLVRAGGSLVFARGLIQVGDRTAMSFSGTVKIIRPRPDAAG